jgi:hypothetical protein
MTITGYLREFSLAELFRFLDQGYKTGLLTLKVEEELPYYIWCHQGRIVASANSLSGDGLISLMRQRKFISDLDSKILINDDAPLGLSLKSQSVIDAEQLKMLFAIQVMRNVCTLFTLNNAWFEFNSEVNIPLREMTGLSAPATEITLAGLRTLKDWSALQDKLPESTSSLVSITEAQSKFRLNHLESKIWEFTDGKTAIAHITRHLDLPLEQIQQAAFRLIVIGLAEEIPLVDSIAQAENNKMETDDISESLSQSFLENLVNFLDQV